MKKYYNSNKELIKTNKSYNEELENFKQQYNDLLLQFKLQEKYQDKEENVLNKLVHKCENLSKKIATMDCNQKNLSTENKKLVRLGDVYKKESEINFHK
jgi:transketolase